MLWLQLPMREAMKKEKRHCGRIAGFLLGAAVLLAGCGDDISVSVELVTPNTISYGMQDQGTADGAAERGEGEPGEPEDGGQGSAGQSGSNGQSEGSDQQGGKGQSGSGGQTEGSDQPEGNGQKADNSPDGKDDQSADMLFPEELSITISAAGDVTLGNHKEQSYDYSFRQTYDRAEEKSYFFENVADIFAADDMTIVNLEGPLTLSENFREGQVYSIKGDPEYVKLLEYGNIEAVSMGNNHRLDYGEEGSRDTVKTLEEAGIPYAFDDNLGIYETQGIRIGWVSVNEVALGYGVEKLLEDGINRLKEEGVNLILACCHWGIEGDNYPEDYQKKLGRKCIDWGADLVIGHHPHVLQGIDQYQGKYIIYSLANFCFGANRNPADKDTMIFQQTFTFQKDTEDSYGPAQPQEARIIPCSVSSVTSRNDFKPTPLTGEDWNRVIGRINEYSSEYGVSVDEEGVLSYEGNLF